MDDSTFNYELRLDKKACALPPSLKLYIVPNVKKIKERDEGERILVTQLTIVLNT